MKKRYIILGIFILFFLIFYYKNQKLGNTIIKIEKEKIIENILNQKFSYEANVKVKVFSNKNENEYDLRMIENHQESLIEAVGESNISGLRIEKKNGNLIIKNTKLKLDKIYENYREVTDDSLFLSTFGKEYQETGKRKETEKDDTIIIKLTLKNGNRYIKYKELYFNKETGMPTMLMIKDSSKQPKIIIEYTSIKLL